ncbi:uncharacterized protein LOC125661531 [Ostrea edulis]|uniref:uncharacterized protein LOC125661531 n=1 Tax=Ostrea edulis TaxID=37623 RepID=UPI0024AF7CB9|nr:uncharacterized protein LOC125661531 [Ostrea edulis]
MMLSTVIIAFLVDQINESQGFLFTISKNNPLGSCSPNFLCPPMCLQKTASGCKCDCGNMDPSHPEKLGTNVNQQPQSGGYGTQIGVGCSSNWMNCRAPCATAVNPTSGCVECNCPQVTTPRPLTTQPHHSTTSYRSTHPTQTSTSSTMTSIVTTQTPTTNSQSSSSKRTQPASTQSLSTSNTPSASSTSVFTTSSTTVNSCQNTITCILSCTNGFVIDPTPAPDGCPGCSCKTAQTALTTNTPNTSMFKTVSFPVRYTISPSVTTPTTPTRPPSTTLHKIVCPGVFNCSKTCYTGYRLNSQGCPLCECAPLPTGLP